MFGSADCAAVVLKSYVPARWHISHLFSTAGYVTLSYPSVAEVACQLNRTIRFSAPWMAWTKSFWLADQALLVRFGVWHQLQVADSLRWPAWKSGPTPRLTWQALHFVLSTMDRRLVNPVAGFHMSSAGTMRPPWPPASGLAFGAYLYLSRLVWVSGWLLSLKL